MVNGINSLTPSLVSTLFGTTDTSTGVSADILAQWAAAKAGVTNTNVDPTADPKAPIEPLWTTGVIPSDDTLIANAISGKSFFDTSAQLYSDLNATGDYKKLFALYSGVETLKALSARMTDTTLSSYDKSQTQAAFTRGLAELQTFFQQNTFDDVRIAEGDRVDSEQTTLALKPGDEDYTSPLAISSGLTGAIPGLDPNAVFDVVATSSSGTKRSVTIDLSQMGSIPHSLSNVVGFVNNKLAGAGVLSRLEAVQQSASAKTITVGSQTITLPSTGTGQYSLKVNVQGGEQVSFQPDSADPALYAVGANGGGARLIKLTDTSGQTGLPVLQDRPAETADPIGPSVATGWLDDGGAAYETDTNALTSTGGSNNLENNLRAAGDATLSLTLADGRNISVTTAWRAGDQENWNNGDSSDQGILGDLAQRLTQLLHEQGVATGVSTWANGQGDGGLSILTGDGVSVSGLTIGGAAASLGVGPTPPNTVGGLRDGIVARQFAIANFASDSAPIVGEHTITVNAGATTKTFTVDGGTSGIDAATFLTRLNTAFGVAGYPAVASFADNSGVLSLQIGGLHNLNAVSDMDEDDNVKTGTLTAPPAGVLGGLPIATSGQAFGDAVRETVVSGSPLTDNPGAVDVQVVVDTATGPKTVSVSVSAAERAQDPDTAPGQWSQTFQDRLNTALNQAGVYVGAEGNDLTHWLTDEDTGQRIQSITINGVAQTLTTTPTSGIGGAFSVERSFTSAQAAATTSDFIPALQANGTASVSFDTAWGPQTVSASLQPGDDPTLDNAALRLNQALSAAGYDLGVVTTDLSGGGVGLRVVTGASHTVRNVTGVSLGATALATTLDPIDSQIAYAPGAADAATRASRGASASFTIPNGAATLAPSGADSAWFPGRAFDVSVGGDAKVATTRAVATGADGSVYVLADLSGDSATLPIKGQSDVALLKYDSAGKLAYTRMLGASDQASGFALAVSSDGKVAVAGSVTGDVAGADPAKGGADSFVSLYDANGNQLWTQRRAATADDQANAVAFDSKGNVIVAGQTESALGPVFAAGGRDGYVTGFSAAGAQLFLKQFGTGGDDAATALSVVDDGQGGTQIFTGGVESNRGVIRSFDYASNTGLVAGATRDIGYFYGSAINALATDGTNLYIGGAVGAGRLTVANTAQPSVAGQDGFVARVSANLSSTALDRASYIGSAQDDSVNSLALVNGDVYAGGVTNGVLFGAGTDNIGSSFVARLGSDGVVDWSRNFNTSGGGFTLTDIAADASGFSALDVLGLPRGTVASNNSSALVSRSAVRAGDQFQIGPDARHLSTITVSSTETLGSLAGKINLLIGGAGNATIVTDDTGAQRIQITANDGKQIAIGDGPGTKNALPGLGLKAGVIAVNQTTRGAIKNFGLGLVPSELQLTDSASIQRTTAVLSAAGSIIRQAYDALLHPNAAPETDEQKALDAKKAAAAAETPPAYLTAQLANYQAALARLTGSS